MGIGLDRSQACRAQRGVVAAVEAWHKAAAAPVLADLDQFGRGVPLGECPALTKLFERKVARELSAGLVRALAAELAREPLAQVPFRHGYRKGHGQMRLAVAGRAHLGLSLYEPQCGQHPRSVSFVDGESHEIVLAGRARIRLVSLVGERDGRATLAERCRTIGPGSAWSVTGADRARIVEDVERPLVVLRLGRIAADPRPSREFALADGRLLHRAAGTQRDSAAAVALALLGAMGRTDAAPAMAELARAGDDDLRWQALRHCLALDTARGMATLRRIAGEERDSLATPAAALAAQLCAAYPQLAEPGVGPCPA